MHGHAASGARHETALTDAFVDRFGIVGPPELVADRFRELIDLGLDHFVVVGHGRDIAPNFLAESSPRFTHEVVPRLCES